MTPALIFDLDGTLIDSAPDIHAGALQVLDAEGLPPVTFAQTRSFIGRGVPMLIAQIREAHGLGPDPDQAARMVDMFEALYETAVNHTVLYPGALDILTDLKSKGFSLALCTNKPEAPTHAVLAHFGLSDLFDALAFGDGPYPRKPDPAPVAHVMAALGTDHAIYIGDSETDAATAQAAGLPFFLFTEGYRKTPVDGIAHTASFSDFTALPSMITTTVQ